MYLPRPCALAAAVCLLSACEITRPEQAYEPEDASPRTFQYEAEPDAGQDSGPLPEPGIPSPTDESSATVRLQPLAGTYLLRIDRFTKATSPTALGDVRLRSRTSQLLVTRLTASQGKLVGQERLCHQLAEHKCETLCTTFRSQLLPAAINKARIPVHSRTYEVDAAGKLSSSKVTMQLGYTDAAQPGLAPPAAQNELVWDTSTGEPGREGMITRVDVSAPLTALQCYVFNTQRFVTSFTGSLNPGALSLEDASLTVNTDGGAAEIVGSGGKDAADCGKKPAQDPTLVRKAVRFARIDTGLSELACPEVSVFDSELVPDSIDSF